MDICPLDDLECPFFEVLLPEGPPELGGRPELPGESRFGAPGTTASESKDGSWERLGSGLDGRLELFRRRARFLNFLGKLLRDDADEEEDIEVAAAAWARCCADAGAENFRLPTKYVTHKIATRTHVIKDTAASNMSFSRCVWSQSKDVRTVNGSWARPKVFREVRIPCTEEHIFRCLHHLHSLGLGSQRRVRANPGLHAVVNKP